MHPSYAWVLHDPPGISWKSRLEWPAETEEGNPSERRPSGVKSPCRGKWRSIREENAWECRPRETTRKDRLGQPPERTRETPRKLAQQQMRWSQQKLQSANLRGHASGQWLPEEAPP